MIRAGFELGAAPAGPDDTRSLAQRQAAAFKEFVAGALGPGGVLADEPDVKDNNPTDQAAADEPDDNAPVRGRAHVSL
jgi:hypothetical protein